MVWLRGRGITSGDTYEVRFNDVDGMRESSAVQMMGIRIGFVDRIEAQVVDGKYYVNVSFSINDPRIVDALIQAHDAGVDIKLLTAAHQMTRIGR